MVYLKQFYNISVIDKLFSVTIATDFVHFYNKDVTGDILLLSCHNLFVF